MANYKFAIDTITKQPLQQLLTWGNAHSGMKVYHISVPGRGGDHGTDTGAVVHGDRSNAMLKTMKAAIMALSLFTGVWAQVQSGNIVGTITDPAGSVVAGAKVTLVNAATGFQRTVDTDASGRYTAELIPIGPYTITVTVPGFQKLVREGLQLTTAETMTVDLKLTLGSVEQTVGVEQTVEVTGTSPLVQDQSATVSSLVTNQQVVEMPLNGRTFSQLLLLARGATAGSAGALDPGNPYSIRGTSNITVNGSSPQIQGFLVDGIFNRGLWVSSLLMVPTIDSIQEVRVQTNNYSAEYGDSAGAVTVVQTKSGSNAIHGSAYEFLRSSSWTPTSSSTTRWARTSPDSAGTSLAERWAGPSNATGSSISPTTKGNAWPSLSTSFPRFRRLRSAPW